jgi:hypothetical protein
MQFATEVQALPKDDRDFEGSVITAIRFFSGDPDAVFSSHYRRVALAVLVVDGVPGWASDMNADGAIKTHPALFEAAARAPLVWSGNEIRFRRPSFLRIAFQEAKRAA